MQKKTQNASNELKSNDLSPEEIKEEPKAEIKLENKAEDKEITSEEMMASMGFANFASTKVSFFNIAS